MDTTSTGAVHWHATSKPDSVQQHRNLRCCFTLSFVRARDVLVKPPYLGVQTQTWAPYLLVARRRFLLFGRHPSCPLVSQFLRPLLDLRLGRPTETPTQVRGTYRRVDVLSETVTLHRVRLRLPTVASPEAFDRAPLLLTQLVSGTCEVSLLDVVPDMQTLNGLAAALPLTLDYVKPERFAVIVFVVSVFCEVKIFRTLCLDAPPFRPSGP